MKIAIMQPYAFPYLGYFQMAAAVDRFVVLDDVAYSRGGWINRNRPRKVVPSPQNQGTRGREPSDRIKLFT